METRDSASSGRFWDTRDSVRAFTDEVLVRCPACDGCAVVLGDLEAPMRALPGCRHLLRCRECGLFKHKRSTVWVFDRSIDPYYHLPVWLQADCRGHLLWAYNLRHLELLESYVAARLRERGAVSEATALGIADWANLGVTPLSMVERLPAWLKSAKNRDQVLRIINRLRSSVPTNAE